MNKALKLINNESKNLIVKSIKPLLSCDDTELNICPYRTAHIHYKINLFGGSFYSFCVKEESLCYNSEN